MNKLVNHPFFQGLSEATSKNILASSFKFTFESGKKIVNEGSANQGIYFITEGLVKISKLNDTRQENAISLLDKNKCLGIDSLINAENNKITAEAVVYTETIFLSRSVIHELIVNDKGFHLQLLKFLCDEIESYENKILTILHKPIINRLAKLLTEGAFYNKHIIYLEQLSIEDISSILGTTKTYLYNTLNKLKKMGYLCLENKTIVITNSVGLKKLAEAE